MKRKYVIAMVIIAIAGGAAAWQFKFRKTGPTYKEFTIVRGDLATSILATGTVQPENRLEIKPPVAGRAEQVLVEEGDKVKKGQILAWISSNERAALIDSARSQGPAEVKRWEELYKPTPVLAPITGTIILRAVQAGQAFLTSDPILVESDRLTVKAQVDETDLAQIHLKQKGEIRLDAYPDQALEAQVDQVAFEAKTVSNVTTYLVDVLPDQTPPFMRAGMTANVTFFIDSKKDILLVPNEFIRYDNGRALVLVKMNGEDPQDREIKVGATDGKSSEVLNGLKEGDVILMARLSKDKRGANPFSPMGGTGGGRRGR